MRIRLAKTAGFCMGVRRAVEMAEDAAEAAGANGSGETPIYTYGPLIHNSQAVELLRQRGVNAVDSVDNLQPARIVIRAHGITKEEQDHLDKSGFSCIDATCPHVLASRKRIAKASAEGKSIVLVGDRDHAEVIGLASYAATPVHLISTPAEAREINPEGAFCVIAQTTFNAGEYEEICKILANRRPDCVTFNSICEATAKRQAEAEELAAECDAVVVVGGRHSANTVRLAEIVHELGKPVFHVETATELDLDALKGFDLIGVTAGASTPGWLTQTVIERIQSVSGIGLVGTLRHLVSISVKSYIYSAVGALCLSFAVKRLLGTETYHWQASFIVFSYIFSVYIFNRRSLTPLSETGLKMLGGFYQRYRTILFTLAGILSLVSFIMAWQFPHLVILLAITYIGGIVYSFPLLPRGMRWRRLKDIPASKDIFVASAWAVIVAGVPVFISDNPPIWGAIAGSAVFVFLLVFGKTMALDLRDIEGD
ncbi:MAG: 4-hydroxy-3-methylbut-2-enyl diphosphate reductase, partial [Planctomycetes bacterium]|nr:4-hydroxy-3-methylbut-2-enyl diphosphate reductase [Planctomycetota bacterium]